MANTGCFCFLTADGDEAERLAGAFLSWVDAHPDLKNARVVTTWRVVSGEIDRLQPKQLREFLVEFGGSADLKAFLVNSIYGDDWEPVEMGT